MRVRVRVLLLVEHPDGRLGVSGPTNYYLPTTYYTILLGARHLRSNHVSHSSDLISSNGREWIG